MSKVCCYISQVRENLMLCYVSLIGAFSHSFDCFTHTIKKFSLSFVMYTMTQICFCVGWCVCWIYCIRIIDIDNFFFSMIVYFSMRYPSFVFSSSLTTTRHHHFHLLIPLLVLSLTNFFEFFTCIALYSTVLLNEIRWYKKRSEWRRGSVFISELALYFAW